MSRLHKIHTQYTFRFYITTKPKNQNIPKVIEITRIHPCDIERGRKVV